MIFYSLIVINKSRKVLLSGVHYKDLKPIASLLHPSNLIIPLLVTSILGQISDNLKNSLSNKEVQRLPSVKFYSRVLYSGFNSVSLSTIFSLSKTLGPELEALSALTVVERLDFLRSLQKKIIFSNSPSKILSNLQSLYNPNELIKHRRGLAIQFRSTLVANSLFSVHSITLGIPISQVNLYCIIESAKLLWVNLGLQIEEFDFLLRKQAINILKNLSYSNKLSDIDVNNDLDCLKLLAYSEFTTFYKGTDILEFDEDMVIINGEENLVLIEEQLGFLRRSIPKAPKEVFVTDSELGDILLRSAVDQRKTDKLQLDNMFKRYFFSKKVNKKIFNSDIKKIKFRKLLNENQIQ